MPTHLCCTQGGCQSLPDSLPCSKAAPVPSIVNIPGALSMPAHWSSATQQLYPVA